VIIPLVAQWAIWESERSMNGIVMTLCALGVDPAGEPLSQDLAASVNCTQVVSCGIWLRRDQRLDGNYHQIQLLIARPLRLGLG
jgi:hypothetical protein